MLEERLIGQIISSKEDGIIPLGKEKTKDNKEKAGNFTNPSTQHNIINQTT